MPSGKAKFNWVDVKNVGEAIAHYILKFDNYQNRAYEITGTENKDFEEVASIITEITGNQIRFKNINPLSFFLRKKKEGMKSGLAIVMTILHFLPRFQDEPEVSHAYQQLTGKPSTTLHQFIAREKKKFTESHQSATIHSS